MRKRMLILAAACALLLTACGGGKDAAGGTGGETSGQAETVQESSGAAAVPAEQGPGYVFRTGGTEIAVDAEAAPVLDALGEADSYYEAASCAFEGLDKFYTYGSFEVDTYPDENGVDRISYVLLKDDLVSTAEGVSIGDDAAKVADTYGAGTEEGSAVVYEKGGMRLFFGLEDGAVSSIQYQTTVLNQA